MALSKLHGTESARPILSALELPNTRHKSEDVKDIRIENFIGFCKMPIGIVGLLRTTSTDIESNFYAPLAN